MIRFLLSAFLAILIHTEGISQKLSGQWTGGFTSSGDPYGGKTDYVLELEIKEKAVSGYSYTYFNAGRKRYFTICRLTGSYDKRSKSLIVKEVEKVKGNTPLDFKDCFQTHSLTFFRSEGREMLAGKWKPATDKDNCGNGKTELERKALVKVIPQNGNATAKVNKPYPKVGKKNEMVKSATSPSITTKEDTSNKHLSRNKVEKNPTSDERITKREKQIYKTLEVTTNSCRIELYDNGQIDGDSVSLYLNEKLFLAKQRLSKTPIVIKLDFEPGEEKEVLLIADNLGTIPPNTALMVIIIGDKKEEINLSTSEKTNFAIKFVRKL
ncbi:MAG: hypothetical protein ACK43L_06185 [Sphingobacteriales bacterium]